MVFGFSSRSACSAPAVIAVGAACLPGGLVAAGSAAGAAANCPPPSRPRSLSTGSIPISTAPARPCPPRPRARSTRMLAALPAHQALARAGARARPSTPSDARRLIGTHLPGPDRPLSCRPARLSRAQRRRRAERRRPADRGTERRPRRARRYRRAAGARQCRGVRDPGPLHRKPLQGRSGRPLRRLAVAASAASVHSSFR